MQKRKRNHWISQAYLRSFATDPRNRKKIWRFSKNAGTPELKPIEKVAVRYHLYAPKTEAGVRDYSFEEKLSRLENWFGDPLWSQLCNDMVDLQWKPLRKMVALLVAVMYLRNPLQFEHWKAMHRQIVDMYASLPQIPTALKHKGKTYELDTSTWPAYRDATEDDLKRDWLEMVGGAADTAKLLMSMRWAMVFSDEPVFVTTDNPVTVLHPSLRFRGLRDPETSILFPLSPTRCLHLDNRHGEPDGQYYPLNDTAPSTNLLLWRYANDHLFSHRDPDLVCVELIAAAKHAGYVWDEVAE